MHPTEYQNIADHEATYWWFQCKRRLIKDSIQRYGHAIPATARMLDIGCGPGGNLAVLRQFAPQAMGMDFSLYALQFARQNHQGALGQASVLDIPLQDHSIDLVTILDVLYHQWIPDDSVALQECYRILKPGGVLILTDSAFSFLNGPHDATNLAARRYTVSEMHQNLTNIGFEIEKESYVYALLFPIAFLKRWGQRTFSTGAESASDIQPLPPWLNTLLLKLTLLELTWLKFGRLPFGTSIFFVARKPEID
ncbi:MAG: class I SAM-dependent methyltransferase [Chloroflexota bacterium]